MSFNFAMAQELRGRRVTLSLVRRVEGDLGASHRLSFGGWSLDNCRKASGSEDSWSATGGAAVAAVRPFLP